MHLRVYCLVSIVVGAAAATIYHPVTRTIAYPSEHEARAPYNSHTNPPRPSSRTYTLSKPRPCIKYNSDDGVERGLVAVEDQGVGIGCV